MSEQLTEEQFKQKTVAAHQEYFEHVFRLNLLAQDSLQQYKGFMRGPYEATLVLILPRAFKAFDSIRRLCEVASCEDAAIVLRSLLNLMVVTRWISLSPQERATKYLAWYWVEMQRQSKRRPDKFPPTWIVEIEKRYDSVKSQFEYVDAKGKRKFAKHWYQPEAHSIYDLFKAVDLEDHYNEAYSPLSGIEHSDAMAYFAMFVDSARMPGERKLEIQSDLFLPHYLRNGFQYFADIFGMCNKTLAYVEAGRLQAVVDVGLAFYKADMKAKRI